MGTCAQASFMVTFIGVGKTAWTWSWQSFPQNVPLNSVTQSQQSNMFCTFPSQINEAGQRWLKLIKEEWSTKLTYPVSRGTTFRFRGFKGDYEIIIKKNGNPIKVQTFTLENSGSVVDVLVDGDGREDKQFLFSYLLIYLLVFCKSTQEYFTSTTGGQNYGGW